MAKPEMQGNIGKSSSYGRTFTFDGSSVVNPSNKNNSFTKSNDFLYVAQPDTDYETPKAEVDGLGGADQIIFQQDGINIGDAYFTNFSSFEVVKLANGVGSTIDLGAEALQAGIKEVTGGDGDDTITFGAAYDGDSESDPVVEPTSVKVDGGDGDDVITTAGGDDTITGGEGADVMSGGGGVDTFVFAATGDTVAASSVTVSSGVVAFADGADVIINFDDASAGQINSTTVDDVIKLGDLTFSSADFLSFGTLSLGATDDQLSLTDGSTAGIFAAQGDWDGVAKTFTFGTAESDIDFLFVTGASGTDVAFASMDNWLVFDNSFIT